MVYRRKTLTGKGAEAWHLSLLATSWRRRNRSGRFRKVSKWFLFFSWKHMKPWHGGGFKHFLCSSLFGEMIQFDLCIFFRWVGWFNHQLGKVSRCFGRFFFTWWRWVGGFQQIYGWTYSKKTWGDGLQMEKIYVHLGKTQYEKNNLYLEIVISNAYFWYVLPSQFRKEFQDVSISRELCVCVALVVFKVFERITLV